MRIYCFDYKDGELTTSLYDLPDDVGEPIQQAFRHGAIRELPRLLKAMQNDPAFSDIIRSEEVTEKVSIPFHSCVIFDNNPRPATDIENLFNAMRNKKESNDYAQED